MEIQRVTNGSKHHFFGFHDLKITNFNDDKALSLAVETINRPPLPGEFADVGYVKDGQYVKLGTTNAYNYPQGARMQWVNNTELFVVNNQVNNQWGANLYDTETNKLVDTFDQSIHCLSSDGLYGFTLNYARLFRLGVYGYVGLDDTTINNIAPKNDGIFVQNLKTKEVKLIKSIYEIANHEALLKPDKGFHHYVTHLCINPSNTRLAFLHRYRLEDGGETTRLMTIGVDGEDLRCLTFGFLSHFDWIDDKTIMIYGQRGGAMEKFRNNKFLANPIIGKVARSAKGIVKSIMKAGSTNGPSSAFITIEDSLQSNIRPFAAGIILTDGHPMVEPNKREWLVNDTYPNEDGIRDLMLYDIQNSKRIDLGTFKKIDDLPDYSLFLEYSKGVDEKILQLFSKEAYSFTRSGLHCDLHPRWNSKGTAVYFDSIHEGTRQLYKVDVSSITK